MPLVEALLKRFPTDPAGADHRHAHRPRARAGAVRQRVDVRYVPIDLPGSVRRFFQRVQPQLADHSGNRDLAEPVSPLRPTRRAAGARERAHLAALGEQLSAAGRAVSRDALARHLHRGAEREDAERFVSIGANPARTHVVGNIKFDFGYPPDIEARGHELRRLLGRASSGVGGGQHAREGRRRVARRASRWCASASRMRCWCWCRGIRRASPMSPRRCAHRRCRSSRAPAVTPCTPNTQVFLLDTLGELAAVLRRGRCGVRRRQPGAHRRPQPARARGARPADPGGAAQFQFRGHRENAGRAGRGAHRAGRADAGNARG